MTLKDFHVDLIIVIFAKNKKNGHNKGNRTMITIMVLVLFLMFIDVLERNCDWSYVGVIWRKHTGNQGILHGNRREGIFNPMLKWYPAQGQGGIIFESWLKLDLCSDPFSVLG